MKDIYPVVIVQDRYGGCYSKTKWQAWNMDCEPEGANSSDIECADFWDEQISTGVPICGKGSTPNEALKSLEEQMEKDNRK
jgi:hypothetical protein